MASVSNEDDLFLYDTWELANYKAEQISRNMKFLLRHPSHIQDGPNNKPGSISSVSGVSYSYYSAAHAAPQGIFAVGRTLDRVSQT